MTGMLRNINFKIFVLIVLLFECDDKLEEKLPADIIIPELMKKIIFDINLAETKLLRRSLQDQPQMAQRKADLKFILDKHDVSDSLFDLSYAFYSQSPNHFKAVLEGAIEMAEEKTFILNNEDSLSKKSN